MGYDTIQFEQEGSVGVLRLNRPEVLNAINTRMRDELRSFFLKRLHDYDLRVIVVTGSGRGFCSGMDLKDFAANTPQGGFTPEGAQQMQSHSDLVVFMRRCPQPLIGAINGPATGAGLALALVCDVRLASPEARFAAANINIGLGGADMGTSWFLPRAVGLANASRYLMTGDFFGADEAYRMGMVQAVVDKERLMEEAMDLARKMASKSPLGLRLTKEAMDQNFGASTLEDALRLEDRNQAMCIAQLAAQGGGERR